MTDFFIWAHRGASAFAPENTLAAFRLAEACGAPGIELDVHLSRDGVPMVLHDDTVDRTTDGRGRVAELTRAQLQRLDAGRWFHPRFAGERLPTLEEVFSWLGARLRVNVEIKDAAAGAAVVELLRRYPQVRPLVSSFNLDALEALRRRDSRLPLGFLSDRRRWRPDLQRAVASRAESFHPGVRRVSRTLVRETCAAGLALVPYTVDDPELAARLRAWGAGGIFTNRLLPSPPR